MYVVSIQGITPDLTTANGVYDPVEFQPATEPQLNGMLVSFARVVPLPPGDEDLCPPNMVVEGPAGSFAFSVLTAGELYCDQANNEVTVDEALAIATGRLAAAAKRPEVGYPPGMQPVRSAELGPTDPNLESYDVNTTTQPQAAAKVWKDSSWRTGSWFMLLFATVGLMFLILGLQSPIEPLAIAGGGAGLVLFVGLFFLLRSKGFEIFRMGVDPATNTLWWIRNQRVYHEGNWNCMTALELHHEKQMRYNDEAYWQLVAVYSNGERERLRGTEFQRKAEIKAVHGQSLGLLGGPMTMAAAAPPDYGGQAPATYPAAPPPESPRAAPVPQTHGNAVAPARGAPPAPGNAAAPPSAPRTPPPTGGMDAGERTRFCTSCGAPLGTGAKFCEHCGTPA